MRYKRNPWHNEPRLYRIGDILTIVAAAIFIGMLLYLLVVPNVQRYSARPESELVFLEPVSRCEIAMEEAPLGTAVEYRLRLDNSVSRGDYLSFYTTHQNVEVYKGEALLYSLRYPEANRFGRTVGVGWTKMPLMESDRGRELRVVTMPVYQEFLSEEPLFMQGTKSDVLRIQLQTELPQIILSILVVIIGIVYQFVAGYLTIKRRRYEKMAMLGIFSVLLGSWKLADCILAADVFSGKPAFLHYLAMASLFLTSIPMIRFVRSSMRKQQLIDIYVIAAGCVILAQEMLQILGILDLRQTLVVTHVIMVTGVLVILASCIINREHFRENVADRRSVQLLFICLIGAMADVVDYYAMGSSVALFYTLTGFLLYVILAGIFNLQHYLQQEKRLREQEKELVEQRVAVMVSQIQPHFIYNTLGTIRYLCRTDPDQAAQIVQEFSMYLRGNFGELNNPTPIRISKELEHVRHYAAIEKVRFPDMEVTYDLRSSEFFLPALSVQPLVENAIKHGLMKLESGGCVEVATYETESAYFVRVSDNGAGFDTKKVIDPGKHIGIQNIRGRLQAMCGGSLTIESTPGQGTVALIRIPKEVQE